MSANSRTGIYISNEKNEMREKCPYCFDRGYIYVEPNSSLTYPCPDCVLTEDDPEVRRRRF